MASGSQALGQVLSAGREAALELSDIFWLIDKDIVKKMVSTKQLNLKRTSMAVVCADAFCRTFFGEDEIIPVARVAKRFKDLGIEYDAGILSAGEHTPGFVSRATFRAHLFGRQIVKLADLLPPADFRVYSIASSPSVYPEQLHLCVHHVEYKQKSASKCTPVLCADLHPEESRFDLTVMYYPTACVCLSSSA